MKKSKTVCLLVVSLLLLSLCACDIPGAESDVSTSETIEEESEDIIYVTVPNSKNSQSKANNKKSSNSQKTKTGVEDLKIDESLALSEKELSYIYDSKSFEGEFALNKITVALKVWWSPKMKYSKEFFEDLFSGVDFVEVIDQHRESYEYTNWQISTGQIKKEDVIQIRERAVYTIVLPTEDRENVINAIQVLKNNPYVAYAEPIYKVKTICITDILPEDSSESSINDNISETQNIKTINISLTTGQKYTTWVTQTKLTRWEYSISPSNSLGVLTKLNHPSSSTREFTFFSYTPGVYTVNLKYLSTTDKFIIDEITYIITITEK